MLQVHLPEPGSQGTITFTNRAVFTFTLYGGLVHADGTIPNPMRLAQGNEPVTPVEQAIIDAPTFTLEAPRSVRVDDTRVFAFASGSPPVLHVQFTDLHLNPVGALRSVALGGVARLSQPHLYDLFVRDRTKWIALVGAGPTTVIVVAGDRRTISATSLIEFPAPITGCLGACLHDTDSLYLFPSVAEEHAPAYASVRLGRDGSVAGSLSWRRYVVPGGRPYVALKYQDVVRRCRPKHVELIVSTNGYFDDATISSSLHRFRFEPSAATLLATHHHSAYGAYEVAFSRSEVPLGRAACTWNRIEPSPFLPGLYGQVVAGIKACDERNGDGRSIVEHPSWIGGVLIDGLLEGLRKYGLLWGDDLADLLAKPDFLPALLRDRRLRDRTSKLIAALDRLVLTREAGQQERAEAEEPLRALMWLWLDGLYLYRRKDWERLSSVVRALDWRTPEDRAKQALTALWKDRSGSATE